MTPYRRGCDVDRVSFSSVFFNQLTTLLTGFYITINIASLIVVFVVSTSIDIHLLAKAQCLFAFFFFFFFSFFFSLRLPM